MHDHPVLGSTGRVDKHALHCRAVGTFKSVHVGQDHSADDVGTRSRSLLRWVRFGRGRSREDMTGRWLLWGCFVVCEGPGAGADTRTSGFLGTGTGPFEGPGNGWSTINTSPSPVRSITLFSILSFAALSASRWAVAPEPHAILSFALRSAACAANSRGLIPAVFFPPSLPPLLMMLPILLRLSAASTAFTLAKCGGRSCETFMPSLWPSEKNPSPA